MVGNRQTKIIGLIFDRFSLSTSLHRNSLNAKLKLKQHTRFEKDILGYFDLVLYTNALDTEIQENNNSLKTEFILMEHPLLRRFEYARYFYNDKVNISFTGSLASNIRNPKYTAKVFSKLLEYNHDFNLHFFINGNYGSELNKLFTKFQNQVINHGQVSSEIAHAAMSDSDFLLSVGNNDINQFPSKIFEYMSTGNPIIHFTKSEKDPVNIILEKYSNALIIREKNANLDDVICAIEGFIIKKKGYKISFDDLKNMMPEALQSNTARLILDRINNP
jgi:glycosyltransferase involved in cell wall biosynthesis